MLEGVHGNAMALRLDGKVLARDVEHRLQTLIERRLAEAGRPPGLAVLRVGDDPASAVYVANKEKACARIGVAKTNSVVEMEVFDGTVRDDLNFKAPRVMAVLDPLKVVIENVPEDQEDIFDAPSFPHDVPREGSRPDPFSREIWIEPGDFMETPSKGYHRLSPGCEVRLR